MGEEHGKADGAAVAVLCCKSFCLPICMCTQLYVGACAHMAQHATVRDSGFWRSAPRQQCRSGFGGGNARGAMLHATVQCSTVQYSTF